MSTAALRTVVVVLLLALIAAATLIFAPGAGAGGATSGCAGLTAAWPYRVTASATLNTGSVAVRASRVHQPTTTVTARDSDGDVIATRRASGAARTVNVPAETTSASVRVSWNVPGANDPKCQATLRR